MTEGFRIVLGKGMPTKERVRVYNICKKNDCKIYTRKGTTYIRFKNKDDAKKILTLKIK